MIRSTTDTCCLSLPLVVEQWQSDRLEKRFELARQIYNSLLRYELKKLRRLESSEDYAAVQSELTGLLHTEPRDEAALKRCFRERELLRREAGLSEFAFKNDVKLFYKHFNDNIGSKVAVQGIAAQVWQAFESMLYRGGKTVYFKRPGELKSVRGHSIPGKSGGCEIIFRGSRVDWRGLSLKVKRDAKNDYETEMLQKRVKFCRIVKKDGRRAPRWYVQVVLEGKPALKRDKKTGAILHPAGSGAVGIDLGALTVAYVSETEAGFKELADQVQDIDREKRRLQRKMDRSRRAMNPNRYEADGSIRRGLRQSWVKSKRYLAAQRELAHLTRQQAEVRKRQHTELANHLLSLGDRFYMADIDWYALKRRAKETEVSARTGRCKSKRRLGRAVADKAPATLIRILDLKLIARGLHSVYKVSGVRASRFNHMTGEYQKTPPSRHWIQMPDGRRLEKDLYAAFLLRHTNLSLNGLDTEALERDYAAFLTLHDEVIKELQTAPMVPRGMKMIVGQMTV